MEWVKVEQTDSQRLLNWANDPEVRRQSFNQALITETQHRQWFEGIMADTNCFMRFAGEGQDKLGIIRVQVKGHLALVSYSVALKARGKGVGTWMLEAIKEPLKEAFPQVTRLSGEVKPDNIASRKAFQKAGYQEAKNEQGYIYIYDYPSQ